MRIGQVAEITQVNVQTIRYYERCGFLRPSRRPSGYRDYSPDAISAIVFVKHAQSFGFTLKEIYRLLSLRKTHSRCADVKAMIGEKIAELDARIKGCLKTRARLVALDRRCAPKASTNRCPLFDALRDPTKWGGTDGTDGHV